MSGLHITSFKYKDTNDKYDLNQLWDMKMQFNEVPNQKPIVYVIIVLGLLSYLSTFPLTGIQERSLLLFDITTVVGIICALFAWPLGLKLSNKIRTTA